MEQAVKVIPPHSKFTSELDMSRPEDREEMNNRVFGRNHRRDGDDKPIPDDQLSDFSIKKGLSQGGRLASHVAAIEVRGKGSKAAKAEAERIVKLNPKYKAALDQWLTLKVPIEEPI